jgi:hypothetical protein
MHAASEMVRLVLGPMSVFVASRAIDADARLGGGIAGSAHGKGASLFAFNLQRVR